MSKRKIVPPFLHSSGERALPGDVAYFHKRIWTSGAQADPELQMVSEYLGKRVSLQRLCCLALS